ncbi:MAG: type 1 glutamine amidotransferase domain-containing protein [Candidatus Melainabacteria bacterium]|nr:type 1 glutamine amidotransferase domain-containing protein [Candidatus Melainabacteria bacterium]
MKILIVTTSCDRLANDHPTGLWLEEFAVPYNDFVRAGAHIIVASPLGGPVPIDPKTEPNDKQKKEWAAQLSLLHSTRRIADVDPGDLDAVFIPGGHGPMIDLVKDGDLQSIIELLHAKVKIIAALCHGPAALINPLNDQREPIIAGRKITGFSNLEEKLVFLKDVVPFLLEDKLKEKCAIYESAKLPMLPHVVRDGNIVTGQNPASSKKLAEEVIEALKINPARLNLGKIR